MNSKYFLILALLENKEIEFNWLLNLFYFPYYAPLFYYINKTLLLSFSQFINSFILS